MITVFMEGGEFVDKKSYIETRDQNTKLSEALWSANEMCRSMASIAERKGNDTNWEAFIKKLQTSLEFQHKVMHPDVPKVETK